MGLDGLGGQEHPRRILGVGEAIDHEVGDLALPRGEGGEAAGSRAARRTTVGALAVGRASRSASSRRRSERQASQEAGRSGQHIDGRGWPCPTPRSACPARIRQRAASMRAPTESAAAAADNALLHGRTEGAGARTHRRPRRAGPWSVHSAGPPGRPSPAPGWRTSRPRRGRRARGGTASLGRTCVRAVLPGSSAARGRLRRGRATRGQRAAAQVLSTADKHLALDVARAYADAL